MPGAPNRRTAFSREPSPRALPAHPLLARVGRTPLVELQRLTPGRGRRVFAKLEGENPGGSVKDRAALSIVEGAWEEGLLPGRRLLDASSGNTGIAYALLGAALGFGVTICLPGNASPERKKLLGAYGAEVLETDPLDGSDGAIRKARELAAGGRDVYFYADQYSNPANPEAHERTTGPEILRQLAGLRLDLFAAGLGTSGTFVGTARFLRRRSPSTRLLAVQPDAAFHGIEGLKHMASAIVPRIWEPGLADLHTSVATEEAQEMTRRLAREEGILAGVSSGAALAAALRAATASGARTTVVVFPDRGERYLSERFWSERRRAPREGR